VTGLEWALVALLLILAGGVAIGTGVARAHRRDNQVVPGVATRAPAAWAGAHTPEARLHRRLRDAVRAVHAADGVAADPTLRSALEREALAVDAELVAVAALPAAVRAEPLTRVEAAVAAVESAAAALAGGVGDADRAGRRALDEVHERLRLLAEAHAELDQGRPPPPRTQEGDQPQPGT
jgi:hypothetical protein